MSERVTDASGAPDEFELLLSQLRPRASGISRDRLMYLAGRQSAQREPGRRRGWLWPRLTAASWLVTATIAGAWAITHSPEKPVPIAEHGSRENVVSQPESQGERNARVPHDVRPPESGTSIHADAAPAGSTRDARVRRSDVLPPVEAMLDAGDWPRLSMVGWRSWDQGRRHSADAGRGGRPREQAADDDGNADAADVPPATYSQLMKVYLDNSAGRAWEGGVL